MAGTVLFEDFRHVFDLRRGRPELAEFAMIYLNSKMLAPCCRLTLAQALQPRFGSQAGTPSD